MSDRIPPELVGAWRLLDLEERQSVRGEMIYQLDGGVPIELLEPDAPRPFQVTGDSLLIGDRRIWQNTLTRIR